MEDEFTVLSDSFIQSPMLENGEVICAFWVRILNGNPVLALPTSEMGLKFNLMFFQHLRSNDISFIVLHTRCSRIAKTKVQDCMMDFR